MQEPDYDPSNPPSSWNRWSRRRYQQDTGKQVPTERALTSKYALKVMGRSKPDQPVSSRIDPDQGRVKATEEDLVKHICTGCGKNCELVAYNGDVVVGPEGCPFKYAPVNPTDGTPYQEGGT